MERLFLLALLLASTLAAEQVVWEVALPFRDAGRIRLADGVLLTGNVTGRGGTTAFDAATGKLLWRVGGQQRGGPIPGPKVVFTTNHQMGTSALDLKTGKPVWRAPQAVVADYVNIAYHGSNVYVVGFSGRLRALNASDGQLRWEHVHQPGDRAGACLATPAVGDGVLVYGGGAPDGITALLWGLDPGTGSELWRIPIGCAGGISISDGTAVLNSGSTLVAVDTRSGQILWRTPPMPDRKEPSAPVLYQGRAYTIHENGLTGFNLKTGQQDFHFPGKFPTSEKPIRFQIAGGKAYFTANLDQPRSEGNQRGFLYALDLATKQIILRHRVNRDKKYVETWPTHNFLVDGEFIYYENESLLVKLRQ